MLYNIAENFYAILSWVASSVIWTQPLMLLRLVNAGVFQNDDDYDNIKMYRKYNNKLVNLKEKWRKGTVE